MSAFLSALALEFGERRQRMRAAFGDRNATLLEFLLFAGVVAGCLAALLGEWHGLGPLFALVCGYVALELARQRGLASGADGGAVQKRYDRLVFALFAGMSMLGAGFLVLAMQPPAHQFTAPAPGQPLDVELPAPARAP